MRPLGMLALAAVLFGLLGQPVWDVVHNPKWQAMWLAAALIAVSVVAFWAYAA